MTELPTGWTMAPAADVCDLVQSGGTPKEGFIEVGEIPFLKVYNIVNQKIAFEYRSQFVSESVHRTVLKKSTIRPGDVLMNIVGPPLGKIAIVPDMYPEWNCNQAITIFRPGKAIISKWLYYFLQEGQSIRSVSGDTKGIVGQINISLSQCRNFLVPVPPPTEQKRIVARLDSLSARSARARNALSRIETLVKRYKQAVLAKAFSKGSTNNWPRRSIQSLCELVFDGPFGSHLKSGDYTTSGPRVIRLENIGVRSFIGEKVTHISEEKFNALSRHTLKANDLLFSSFISEEIRACLFPEDKNLKAINKADCFCLRIKTNDADPNFLLLQLSREETYSYFSGKVHGATRPRINLGQLKSYELQVPSLQEQRVVVEDIESAFQKIDKLAAEAKRALVLTDKLDEAILAKAFRGELAPQDPNDEPASVLLERIRAERAAAPKATRGRKKTA